MDQTQTIQEYASSRSEAVFKSLVDQYVGLVYSACYRQLKDRHYAEDATQAVFLLLSQKAGKLNQAYLSGWLLTTSRYACANIRKREERRQRREQVVAMNQETVTGEKNDDLLECLDEALCHLSAPVREALILRYLKEQPMEDVAEKLGVSEKTARKRVERGVEKLRRYFSRRGITTHSAAIGAMLTDQLRGSILTAGARDAVTQGIIQICRAGAHGTAASVAVANGTKSMMMFAKLKVAATVAMLVMALGTSGWVISRVLAQNNTNNQVAAPAAVAPVAAALPPATQPEVDLSTPEKAFAEVITAMQSGDRDRLYHCLAADPNREPLLIDQALKWNLASNRMLNAAQQAFGPEANGPLHIVTIDNMMKMMAAAAPVKSMISGDTASFATMVPAAIVSILPPDMQQLVGAWSGAPILFKKVGNDWKFDIDQSMRVQGHNGNIPPAMQGKRNAEILLAMADYNDRVAGDIAGGKLKSLAATYRALRNAKDQMLRRFGLDGVDMMILPVHAKIAAKSDNGWDFYSDSPDYSADMDSNVMRDGHPTLRLHSETAVKTESAHYQQIDDSPQKYLGHRIRVTAWIKSSKVLADAGIRIRVVDSEENVIADEGQRQERPIHGTSDWKMYSAFATVPANADKLKWGVILNGKGSLWIDLDSAKLDIVDRSGQ